VGYAHLCTCDSAIGRCTGRDWEAWQERKNRDHQKSKRTGSGEADSIERQAASLHQTVPDRPRAQHKVKQPCNDRPPACIKQRHLNFVCRTALCRCPALSHAHPYTRPPSPLPPPQSTPHTHPSPGNCCRTGDDQSVKSWRPSAGAGVVCPSQTHHPHENSPRLCPGLETCWSNPD
jgi:hypothetical protein